MKKYILRLQIPVQNIVIMHVLNRMANLPYHHPYFLFRERPLHLQVLVQVTLSA